MKDSKENNKTDTQRKINKKKVNKISKVVKNEIEYLPYEISKHLLDDISIRFLLQISPSDLENVERLFFIFEEAHWFYLDNFNEKPISFIDFCTQISSHNDIKIDINKGLNIFKLYKQAIKVYGCIIFDTSLQYVLIVRENAKINSFGFPKGKKSKDESGIECAIREVKEEIGYDVSSKIIKNLSINLFDKMNFFFVFNVKKSTNFKCNMKNEIMDIIWLPIEKLEEGHLGKKFSIITKSYFLWKDLYIKCQANRFKFEKNNFEKLIYKKLIN